MRVIDTVAEASKAREKERLRNERLASTGYNMAAFLPVRRASVDSGQGEGEADGEFGELGEGEARGSLD